MPGFTKLELAVLLLVASWTMSQAITVDPDLHRERSYQLPPIPISNGIQGTQYIPMATLYPEIPAILLPKQVGMDLMNLNSAQAASNAVLTTQRIVAQPSIAVFENHAIQEPVLRPQGHKYERNTIYTIRKSKQPLYQVKRPTVYNFGRKKIGAYHTKVSIEPSIDITDQLQQLKSSYPSTTPQPLSTYGPAKVIEHQPQITAYLRQKGPQFHPHYHTRDFSVITHPHKGHMHNHYIPQGYSFHKSQYHSSAKPIYPLLLKPTQTSLYEQSSGLHSDSGFKSKPYPEPVFNYRRPETVPNVRFPDTDLKKSLLNAYRLHQEEILGGTQPSHYALQSHSDLTQAIIKDTGTINNYDASLPNSIPSKKPNKFEVKEILRNADVHFIDGGTVPEQGANVDHQQLLQHYQDFEQSVPTHSPYENEIRNYGINHNHIDYYDQREDHSIKHEVRTPQDAKTSESVKVPVAVIKGAAPAKYAVDSVRSGSSKTEITNLKTFTPSSSDSDWIPMSVPPKATRAMSPPDIYFGDLLRKRSETEEPTRIITSNRNIGDIISGRIPGEYSPFKQTGGANSPGDIITGKIPFGKSHSDVDKRKGSVVDDIPNASGTSNHVVSSMIKFS